MKKLKIYKPEELLNLNLKDWVKLLNIVLIKNLYICGPFACFGGTTDGLYMSGQVVADFTLKDMVGE